MSFSHFIITLQTKLYILIYCMQNLESGCGGGHIHDSYYLGICYCWWLHISIDDISIIIVYIYTHIYYTKIYVAYSVDTINVTLNTPSQLLVLLADQIKTIF